MTTIRTEIFIGRNIETCFDASRNLDIHMRTVWKHTREEASAMMTSYGEIVTFTATHFGIRQRLVVLVTEFERPYRFADVMQKGAFKTLTHKHYFKEHQSGTVMTDILEFQSPFGIIGKAVDTLILKHYMKRFLTDRNHQFKKLLEEEGNG